MPFQMKKNCNSKVIINLNGIQDNVERIVTNSSLKLAKCYQAALPMIPESVPYLEAINKCS